MTKNKFKTSYILRVVIAAVITAAIIFFPAATLAESEGAADGGSTASEGFEAGDGSDSGSAIIESAGFADSGFPSDDSASGFLADSSDTPTPPSTAGTDTPPESSSPESNPSTTPSLDSPFEAASESVNQNSGSESQEVPETGSPVDSETGLSCGGNSYVPTITPDAVAVDGTHPDNHQIPPSYGGLVGGAEGTFTITFTEVGDKTIGSAQVEIPAEFSGIGFNNDWSTTNINTSGGQAWEGKLDGAFIHLKAVNEAVDNLANGESVSATFTATTPTTKGLYVFETKAWTDDALADGLDNLNKMANGYSDPVVTVGLSVSTPNDLSHVTNQGLHFVQTANIDLNVAPYNDGSGWSPLGIGLGFRGPFSGSFNGNGFTISNLYVNLPDGAFSDHIGLFGDVRGGTLKNVALTNVNVTGNNEVGSLVGYIDHGTIDNCYATGTGTVNGSYYVGGLAGYVYNTEVTRSHADVGVTGVVERNFSPIGGLIGETYEGVIADSHATGLVSGYSYLGGLVGNNRYTPIGRSYATGDVVGLAESDLCGGLVGNNVESDITGSYATGDIAGHDYVGGLVGISDNSTISDSHYTGNVEGDVYVGGLVGLEYASISATIYRSYSTGSVKGSREVGGLVGRLNGSGIYDSYSTSDVEATDSSGGGLVGAAVDGALIKNSYAIGDVQGGKSIGGLIGGTGMQIAIATIENCYAIGNVQGSEYVGRLIGYNAVSTITSSYAVDQGIHPLVGFGSAAGADNTTLAAMKNIQTYLDAGWSITTTNVVINKAGFNPYPFPVLFWELDKGSEPVWYIYPAGEDDNGNGNGNGEDNGNDNGNGNDNDQGNGDDFNQGPGSDFGFDFTDIPAPALPAVPLQTSLTVAPAAPLVSPGQFLVLAPEDAQTEAAPLVTPEFVRNGNREELTTVLVVYEELFQYFEENWESMSEAEYARALLDLAAAWAAIQAVEALFDGEEADHDLALEAYLGVIALLAEYGALLNEVQLAAVEAIIEAVADVLTVLGVDYSQPGVE